jgi:hypothetical protein
MFLPHPDRLIFLDDTLKGIIKRFEDEFPDTRIPGDNKDNDDDSGSDKSIPVSTEDLLSNDPAAVTLPDSDDNFEAEDDGAVATLIKSPSLSRSNSQLSLSSRALAHEEGRVLRAGHKFRAGVIGAQRADGENGDDGPPDLRSEHYALLASGVEMVGADPNHARLLHELLEELGDEELNAEAREKGVVSVFKERRLDVLRRLRASDPAHWDRFVESQEMARANAKLEAVARERQDGDGGDGGGVGSVEELAVED